MKIVCDLCGKENKLQDFQCECGNINDELFTAQIPTNKIASFKEDKVEAPVKEEKVEAPLKEEKIKFVAPKKETHKHSDNKNKKKTRKGFFK